MSVRLKILINAFATSPLRGSECAVGWNIAKELAKIHDVTVLFGDVWGCRKSQADFVEYTKHVSVQFETDGLRAVYVPPTKLIALITKMHELPGCGFLYYLAYNLWQRSAYRYAKVLLQSEKFDLVHQLNMIGYREPGYMWKLGIPFVWGPVGGGPNEPIAYHKLFSVSGFVKVFLRTVCNELQKRICLRAKKAARVAKKIWAVTDADYHMIHDLWGVECEKMVETGAILRAEGHVREWNTSKPLRVVWSGIHTSRKALPILIHALAQVRTEQPDADIVVDILGEGPETDGWKRLSEKLGVANLLRWHGRLPHDQALKIMNDGHVFAFPSLKEGTPHVVLEALSLGLPVICHNACGMGTVVNDSCGIKVPLRTPEESIVGFADALRKILSSSGLIKKLSLGSLHRAEESTWEAKARLISKAYEEV